MLRLGKFAGLIAGLVFGIMWVKVGLADAVLVLVVGLIGLYIGALLTGEVDLAALVGRFDRSK